MTSANTPTDGLCVWRVSGEGVDPGWGRALKVGFRLFLALEMDLPEGRGEGFAPFRRREEKQADGIRQTLFR